MSRVSAPPRAPRRRARPRRRAEAGCRRACGRRARATSRRSTSACGRGDRALRPRRRRGTRRRRRSARRAASALRPRAPASTAASAPATVASRRPKSNGSHENSAPVALPQTLWPDADGSTGPDIDGNHRLRQHLAEDVVGRRAVRLPQRVEPRQVGGPRDGHAGGRRVHLLERGADGRVVLDGVLERLLEREVTAEPAAWRADASGRGERAVQGVRVFAASNIVSVNRLRNS